MQITRGPRGRLCGPSPCGIVWRMDTGPNRSQLRDMANACVCFRVRRASRVITRMYDAVLAEVGLKATQLTLLCAIELRQDLNMGELGEVMGIEQSTLTRNLQFLESQALVQAKPGDDKRERFLVVTDKGKALLKRAYPL